MLLQTLPAPQSNASDFALTVTVTDKTTGAGYDITGYTAKIDVTKKGDGRSALISAASPSSMIDLTDASSGMVGIYIPAAQMARLCSGTYELGVTIIAPTGEQTNPTIVTFSVVEGHPK